MGNNNPNHKQKVQRATTKLAKLIFPFYFVYKKVKDAFEEINQFSWYIALFFLIILVVLAYDEWNKKAEEDELDKLRKERDTNRKYTKIGKLFVEGKLPPSSLLKEANIGKLCSTHLTIYAVVNGISHVIGKLRQ